MTVNEFIERTRVRLSTDGEHMVLPYAISMPAEDRESDLAFARANKPAIIACLKKKQRKSREGKMMIASVQQKALAVMKAWDLYLFEERQYLASGCKTEKPEPPAVQPEEALASLNEQEYAYYQASLYAMSTDIDRARLGELAMLDIAEASFGYDSIVKRMKLDFADIIAQREQERNSREEQERRQELSQHSEWIHRMQKTG